jgi:tetratricopeptide (TPR) repeat protein
MKKNLLIALAVSGALAAGGLAKYSSPTEAYAREDAPPRTYAPPEPKSVFAGQFLASHFAQSQYDWGAANKYLDEVLHHDPENLDLLKRAMIVAMGAGDLPRAARRAQELAALDDENSLAILILAVDALSRGKQEEAIAALDSMPQGDITDFVQPLLRGWTAASAGRLSYTGALLALHVDDKESALSFARRMTEIGAVVPYDAERAGDLFFVLGHKDEALVLYQGAYMQDPSNKILQQKVTAVKDGPGDISHLIPALRVTTPAQGAAIAMFDMARILYQEQSDSSAKLFAHMALALNPGMEEARLLVGNALARNGRYDEAIKYFSSIGPDNPSHREIQRHIAELLFEAGRTQEAMELLNGLFLQHNDVEALIRVGDMYRNDQDFANALAAYNRAAETIGSKIPEEYWHLLYARGMAYEREGQWQKAEQDLKAALVYRPDHPYLLNYLGYGWADQGLNLEESLELIKRAASMRPDDGYILDSLGWVQFMMGQYTDAVPNLEKAVELLPYDSTLNDHLGDAYWQTGRRLEAKFQWERAANNADDAQAKETIGKKLVSGLPEPSLVREAKTDTGAAAP